MSSCSPVFRGADPSLRDWSEGFPAVGGTLPGTIHLFTRHVKPMMPACRAGRPPIYCPGRPPINIHFSRNRFVQKADSPGKENEFKSQQQLGHLGTPTPELSNESALGFGVGRKRGVRFEGSLEGMYQAPSGAPCPILTSVSALGCLLCLAATTDAGRPLPSRRRDAAQHQPPTTVSPQPRQGETLWGNLT
ncbi:hypothetical protein ABEB36_015840 [Hypothenemus hampei]|uniref:Uncharacterized protein n=1 Tax=Hypothenemus hampei TaxID=57062 RepID=A0ABD1DYM4_HYPHA